jgi:hypothetical protein
MVVVLSLHHQQGDNFCKIQKEKAKVTEAIIYVWQLIVLLSSGAPVHMCVLHYSGSKRGMSTAGLLAADSVHLAHSHRQPICKRQ